MAVVPFSNRAQAIGLLRQAGGTLKRGEIALALGVVAILLVLVLPMPRWLLDISLAGSITFAVLILMTALMIKKPLEFTAFPTVLLVTTLFRLGLNLASTRLILGHGQDGAGGAGHIIQAFGQLMMGANPIIGVIVFGSLSIAVTPKRWSLVIGGRFVGERQDADFTFGVTRNPGYENIYASASYDLAKHFTPILRIDNLLNERYEEVLGYQALSRGILGGVRLHW